MSKDITYQVNRTLGFSEFGPTHSWERIAKRKVPIYCEDCGEKYIYKVRRTTSWFDEKTGTQKKAREESLKCKNKRWYNMFKHWNGDYRKITVSGDN